MPASVSDGRAPAMPDHLIPFAFAGGFILIILIGVAYITRAIID